MMRKQLVVIFWFCSLGIFAQVVPPGYLGKRLTVGYGVDLLPAVSPTAGNGDGGLGLNHSHYLNLEYGVRNRTNFCAYFRYFKTGLAGIGALNYSGINVTYEPLSKLPMQFASYDIGMALKFFHKGFYAPIGKYRKLGLMAMINKVTYEQSRFQYYENSKPKYFSVGPGEYDFFRMAITYELGIERAIADKFVFDAGLRVAVVPRRLFQGLGTALFDDTSSYTGYEFENLSAKVEENFENRIFVHELFSVHLGIGFLAF
ncbi:MAG: hypothetical protein ACJ77K_09820 [Bacteroidia bacterium]